MTQKRLAYTYDTKHGELLDEVVFRHYGHHKALNLVLNANPGLAKLGPSLPLGTKVILPPEPVAEKTFITLWG